MPVVDKTAFVRHSCQKMFDLVNDFESYPQFLPGCKAARVLEQGDDFIVGEITLGKGGITQAVATRNQLTAPERIDLSLVKGPFRSFSGYWSFTPEGEGCRVHLHIEFTFGNMLLGMAFGQLFSQAAAQQVVSFTQRADQLYGA
ncbi:type II toxin-antitoxin system RatA family toxin [Zymobacter palmae]|uniref:Oligoketide cyclase/lipid transport protein n=1 Tax=Zymobacter palmae TaxID=33074 RepID=A0A348HBM8_9GAMM|nr:type II toxin-antitoxin system RatA family toxin [Zymobacter palmae]BBG29030.1 oligoketide cyclase/lipid transport protein [Zymobacter palmae]